MFIHIKKRKKILSKKTYLPVPSLSSFLPCKYFLRIHRVMLHVPIPDNLEFRQSLVDLSHLGIRNLHIDRVLVDALDRGGSRDGDDVWVPGPLG